MKVNKLHEIAILIDVDFLQEMILKTYNDYKAIYPTKSFDNLDLTKIIYKIASNGRVNNKGNKVDVILYYNPEHPILPLTNKPNNIENFLESAINQSYFSTDIGNFYLHSYFSDTVGKDYKDRNAFMLQYTDGFKEILSHIVYTPSISQIVLFADNKYINDDLNKYFNNTDKLFFIENNSFETKLQLDPINIGKYYTINATYIIALTMGLKYEDL